MSIKSKEKDPEPMLDVPNLTDSDLEEEESDDNDGDNDNNQNVNGSDADASSEEEESEMFQSDEDSNPSVVEEEVAVSADDLRKEGNKVFGDGNYTLAIQKYQEAINTGKCSLEDKVKCYR